MSTGKGYLITENSAKILIMLFMFLAIVCKEEEALQKIKEGNFDMVNKGTYHGTAIYLRQGGEYKDLVDTFRNEIEKNRDVLPMITKKFFSVSETLIYKFKFVAFDESTNYLIVRYFARILDDPVYAGYQIQFVYNIETKNLVEIFTAEVPLE